jgi:hypothetical protein
MFLIPILIVLAASLDGWRGNGVPWGDIFVGKG